MGPDTEKKGFDLFNLVLIISLLACLGFGVLFFVEKGRLEELKTAFRQAEVLIPKIRASAEAIAKLHEKERAGGRITDAHDYIEKYIEMGGVLNKDDFTFRDGERPPDKRGFMDHTVTVTFGRGRKNRKFLSRRNIFNILFNIESQSAQFKIARLNMVAKEVALGVGRGRKDPKELSDQWLVREMVVVRRIPYATKKRGAKGRGTSRRSPGGL